MRKIWCALLVFVLLSGCREQIIHNLSESDANRLVTRLHEIQIDAEKTRQPDGKWALAVPEGEEIRALVFIDDSRMFREPSPSLSDKGSMISSRDDQRFKYERALSAEIESTIGSVRGVLEARVHLNMPPTDPLFGQPLNNARGTASVLVVGTDALALSEAELANLVAGASGIPKEGISVLINRIVRTAVDEARFPGVRAAVGATGNAGLLFGYSREMWVQVALFLLVAGLGVVWVVYARKLGGVRSAASSTNPLVANGRGLS